MHWFDWVLGHLHRASLHLLNALQKRSSRMAVWSNIFLESKKGLLKFFAIVFRESLEYLRKLFYFQNKWIVSCFSMNMALYENTFLQDNKDTLLREAKILEEIVAHHKRDLTALVSKNADDDDENFCKLIEQTASMQKKYFLMLDQLVFIEERVLQNQRDLDSLSTELFLIQNARQEQFDIHTKKCGKNAIAKAFIECLNRADLKIREIQFSAISHFTPYLNEFQNKKSHLFGCKAWLYCSEYLFLVFFYSIKWIYKSLTAKRVFSERSSIDRALAVAKDYKFRSEVLVYRLAQLRLQDAHPQELAKLHEDYDDESFSRIEREFALQKQLSLLMDRRKKNKRDVESLLKDRSLIKKTLESIFILYKDKCGKNAFAIAVMTCIKHTAEKIRIGFDFYATLILKKIQKKIFLILKKIQKKIF
uniref:Uncharacterized protein n=1 Tax=Cyphia dentariifolia TaxID=2041117 RepID=A0A291F3Y0_9ASTR|nr:hypothetical protein Cyp_den1Pt1107 [Cyphia dentariifolia]YP_009436584.1 hypothetical protein Cyp_den1Pt1474 [Cyphia dentariifolia]ATG26841.1 hypothetical protein Cyp_den1Pt1107 [Cyphia dentariifolia]ATG26860.1 hypothetical protein Cyp_den1Pt1474 [Cyphia dentariifolia]